ncbi:MAG: HNH endonuclease [Acidobacteriota bacterium]|nr:HNH endonuclease [Acidobacteriota bacterium]
MPSHHKTLHWLAKPVTRKQGMRILLRDQFRCRYCGLDGKARFENALVMGVDFVVARHRKGKNDPSNLVACCRPCNVIKGRRLFADFEQAKAYVLARRLALRKSWEDHAAPAPAKRSAASHVKLSAALALETADPEFSRPLPTDDDDIFVELGGEG